MSTRHVAPTPLTSQAGPEHPRIRVLLVDDQQLVRTGFSLILSVEDDIEVIGQAADGLAGLALARELRPDVILMDVQMPVLDGVAATAQVVAEGLASVIMLTTFDRDDYLFDALRAGASGFLLKNAEPEALVDAVRTVAGGHALLAPEVTRRVIAQMVQTAAPATTNSAAGGHSGARPAHAVGPAGAPTTRGASHAAAAGAHAAYADPGAAAVGIRATPVGPASPHVSSGAASPHGAAEAAGRPGESSAATRLALLTDREREVLGLVAKGLSNAEIARTLFLGEATVKTHVSSCLAKLRVRDRVQAVVAAYEGGLVAPGD